MIILRSVCDNLVGLLVEGSGTERAGIASVRIAFDAYGHLYLNEGHELTDRL